MTKFEQIIKEANFQPHRENLADDIILKASRLQQKTTESFINIFINLIADFLKPKIALTLSVFVLIVFFTGFSNKHLEESNSAENDFVIEQIYFAGL